jgi:hypothetical protein
MKKSAMNLWVGLFLEKSSFAQCSGGASVKVAVGFAVVVMDVVADVLVADVLVAIKVVVVLVVVVVAVVILVVVVVFLGPLHFPLTQSSKQSDWSLQQ